jgi:5-methylcytosine-specific restriction endonuclease McrA
VRQEFSKKVKLAAWERCGGICECGCGQKIISGAVEYDHIIEDALGGEPTLDNCMVMRKRCHDGKTGKRRPALDKTRRVIEKAAGARKTSKPMPFGRNSPFKKTMSGKVVPR